MTLTKGEYATIQLFLDYKGSVFIRIHVKNKENQTFLLTCTHGGFSLWSRSFILHN